jgi:Tol biopolymer transport system component
MNETEIRERLLNLAADAPDGFSAPPQLLRRARRRIALTLASSVVIALAVVAGGIAGVRWLRDSDRQPTVRPADLPRDGEIIDVRGGDLIAVDLGRKRSRILVDGEEIQGRIGNAAWSPDGRWLAYDTEDGLWVMNRQGEPHQATDDAEMWAWSPTAAQIATMRTSTNGNVLTLLDPSTGRETELGAAVGDVTGPRWSPDGSRILYGVRGGSMYSVDVESGEQSLLVQLPGNLDSIDGIDWSPDGAHIAIVADVVGARQALYVMNADGSGVRLVEDNFEPGGWPAWIIPGQSLVTWSPDGTRLAYANFSGPDERELEIWTLSLDDAAPSLVVSHTNSECCIDGGGPVWSPDGTRIAFETDSETDRSHLVVNADGTGDPSEIDELTYLSWRGGWYFCYCYG